MKLKSKDFVDNSNIPSEFTCDGRNVSPQLSWEDVPDGTKSFALSVTDPDAPGGTWIHWLVYDISKELREIERASLPDGAKEVVNDFGRKSYGGPCPPPGNPHRYQFTLYALDKLLDLKAGASKGQVVEAMQGHILARGQLIGIYQR